ncbi:gamma-mobile-trio recombinase GmtY [Microvirga sp. P5_D2]
MSLLPFSVAHARVEHRDPSSRDWVISIFIDGGDEFTPWRDYRFAHAGVWSVARQRTRAQAVGLLIDFMVTRGREFLSPLEKRQELFRAFASALVVGTIQDEGDPSGLYWLPRTRRHAASIIKIATHFTDWLVETKGIDPINPERGATLGEQIAFWHRWNMMRRSSLLAHLKKSSSAFEKAEFARSVGKPFLLPRVETETKAFPEDRFFDLLATGFVRSPQLQWTTYRDQMITLLLHHGGQRVSQPMHLWIDDVYVDPEDKRSCIVHIFHPSDGLTDYLDPSTGKINTILRSEYLRLKYGRSPLTDEIAPHRVGFKNPLMRGGGNYIRVFWNNADAGRLFMTLYKRYLEVRPVISTHPFLLITQTGAPMTARDYAKVHAAAMRRIGLIPAKKLGTTPHGHRHAFGHWLDANNDILSPKMRQICLAHNSVLSQKIYEPEEVAKINSAMSKAQQRAYGQIETDIPTLARLLEQ